MTGRSLFTAAAASDKPSLAIGEIERPHRAVSLLEKEFGAGVGRTEFITNSDGGQDLWPSLHAWPAAVADALLMSARKWLQQHPEVAVVATSCSVDRSTKPVLCVFMLHHISAADGQDALAVAEPPASVGMPSSPMPAAPLQDQCRIGGCGE